MAVQYREVSEEEAFGVKPVMAQPVAAQPVAGKVAAPAYREISETEAFGLDPLVESVKQSQQARAIPGRMLESLQSSFGEPLQNYTPDATVPNEMGMPPDNRFAETRGGAVTGIIKPRGQRRPPEAPVSMGERVSQLTGTAMQVSDMFTSLGKQLLGAAPYWGARTGAKMGGASDVEAAQIAQEAKDYFFPAEVSTPWAKVADALGPAAQRAYNENPVAWIMQKVGKGIEKGADIASKEVGLQPQDYMALADQFMGSFAHAGIKPKVVEAFNTRKTEFEKRFAKAPAAPAAPVDTSVPYDTQAKVEPVDLATRKTQLDEQIKAANQERQAAASKVREAAKYQKLAEKETDPALKEALQKRADLATEELHATLTEQARVKAEQAAAAEAVQQERLGGTTYEVGKAAAPETLSPGDANRIMQASEIQEVLQTPGHLRSAEQLIKLRGALRRSKEAGFISDPELKKALGLFGIISGVGAVAIEGWRSMDPESLAAVREWLHQLVGKGTPEYNMRYPEAPGTRDFMPEWPRGDDAQQPRLFVTDKELGSGLASAALLAGAIKGKGGMWHPEAVTRLATPIENRLITGEGAARNARGEPANPALMEQEIKAQEWSQKSVRNYLNKQAGTEGDPLKDVEIPFEETTKKWGDAMDGLIKSRTADDTKGQEMNLRPGETGYIIAGAVTARLPYRAITDYLSHVGDYLKQNVDPAKLSQYDLVRAVKETAANDARVAKEMEKAAAASTKDIPVYKDFGDGMKWVELKLPEKLTPEQAKGVRETSPKEFFDELDMEARMELQDSVGRELTAADIADYINGLPKEALESMPRYTAVDANGKEIRNNYTDSPATGPTPEQAWLSGRLAEEGNQMGHCVGGYCADVASGDTRILSLRDAKGRSHVTVEIRAERKLGTNPEVIADLRNEFEGTDAARNGIPFDTWINQVYPNTNKPADILQIKGKQNRAPNKAYLPYVQDLVKEGKWGDVRDIQNTELYPHKIGMGSVAPYVYEGGGPSPSQLNLKPGYYTKEELHKAYTEAGAVLDSRHLGPEGQRGSADPKQLGMIAGAGAGALAGAALDEDNRIRGALLGAGAVFGVAALRSGKGLDYAFGALSTQLGNLSPALKLRGRNYERNVMEKSARTLDAAYPFLNTLKKVEAGSELDLALLNGDEGVVQKELKAIPGGKEAYEQVRTILTAFEQTHKELGRFKQGLTNYFPRIVTDVEGLKKALGQEQRTSLDEALTIAEAKMIKERARGLTDVERSLIIDQSLQARPAGSQLPGYARERGVKVVTPELRPFYASPTDSLLRYLSASVQDIEMAAFFGRDLKTRKIGGKTVTDVDTSIGSIVERELTAKRITYEQADNLRKLLKSRFEGGEQTMAEPLQDVRNLTNVALLGQFGSAATQIGDSVMTIYHHGLMPTLGALKQKLTGNAEVSTKDFGLVNHVAEELASSRATGKALQLVFKANGFSLIDQFAKGLNLNAGLIKNRGLAATEKGRAQLAQKYATAFGDEFPQLVQDLREGRVTENVKSLLFSELSDAQPISKMEMSPAYLDNPNGRVLFQMKTYMLKQMDIIRRDGYQEIAKGNYVRGAKNLVGLASAMALSNIPGDVIKDWMSGRDVSLDKIDYMEALLKNFGVSRYTLDKLGEGKLKDTAVGMVTPAAASLVDLLKMDKKAVKAIPLGGRIAYDRFLGGNEAIKDVEYKRERRIERDRIESQYPSIREERLRKQEEKTQKKLETIRNR